MRILMLGTGPFAVPTFRDLLSAHEVPALIARPLRPGKGRNAPPPHPTTLVAEEFGLPVFAPESINSEEGKELIARFAPELLMVCDYGQILSRDLLAIPRLGGINLHASLLPKYRGAAPINWAIYQGEKESGVTVIHMTPLLDGGPALAVRRTPIGPEETAPEFEARLATLGIEAVREAIKLLAHVPPEERPGIMQDPALVTKAPRLKKELGLIDWTRTAAQIGFQTRALKPWPGSYSFLHRGSEPPIRVICDKVSLTTLGPTTAPCGGIVENQQDQLWVQTGDGVLSLDFVQPAGKRAMSAREFLNGHPVKAGDYFGSEEGTRT